MHAKNTYVVVWLIVAVLLFFCFFGPTDAEGFHIGWLVATRPGWLWFTVLSYVLIVAAGFVLVRFLTRSRNGQGGQGGSPRI